MKHFISLGVLTLASAALVFGQAMATVAGGGIPVSPTGAIGAPSAVQPGSEYSEVASDTGLFAFGSNSIANLTPGVGGVGSVSPYQVTVGGTTAAVIYEFTFDVPNENRVFSGYTITAPLPPILQTVAGMGVYGDVSVSSGTPATSVEFPHVAGVLVANGMVIGTTVVFVAATRDSCVVAGQQNINIYSGYLAIVSNRGIGKCGQTGSPVDGALADDTPVAAPVGLAAGPDGSTVVSAAGGIYSVDDQGILNIVYNIGTGSHIRGNGDAVQLNAVVSPAGVAADTDGTIYFTDVNNSVVFKIPPGSKSATAIAGTGTAGFGGDGGPATKAVLNIPQGVAVDSSHNIWIADTGNLRVREISATTGVINTVYGNGSGPYAGDGAAAVNAQLYQPNNVAVDASGDIYIADSGNYVIRKVDTNGIITTFAGNGKRGSGGDGGPPTSASFTGPLCVAVAPDGSVVIGDAGTYTVRKVSNGKISTIAGTAGKFGTPQNGALASASLFLNIGGLLYDASGNLLIMDVGNGAVYSVSASTGKVTRLAGGGSGGDGGPATSAALQPSGFAIDAAGDLYIAELYLYDVRRVDAKTGIITTIAGMPGSYGYSGNGGPATSALLAGPTGVAVDSGGNVFIADTYNNSIRMVDTKGNIQQFAGNPAAVYTGSGVLASAAFLNTPMGITLDASGNLYIADTGNHLIKKVTRGTAPAIGGVVNSAGTKAIAIAPGEIVAIYGANLGPTQLAIASLGGSTSFPTSVSGMQVSFNGIPAPIYYTSAGQAAAIVPYEVTGTTATVQITYQNQTSPAAFTVPLAATAPGIFTANSSGSGQAAALNTDGTVNSASNPVHPGGVIVLYCTGEGLTNPGGVDGLLSTGPIYPVPQQPVSVTIGGLPAALNYAGEAPYLVAGVLQINAVVPAGVTKGNAVPVTLQVGPNYAQAGVTIAVQ